MFFPVFFEVSIKIDSEIKGEFILIFESLTFFLIKTSTIDVDEEILRLISNESCLFLHAPIDFNLKIELLIKCSIETS